MKPVAIVSDHAVLRYLERVEGVDLDALRRQIARTVDQAARQGATGVVVDGFCYKLVQDSVAGPVVATVRVAGSLDVRHGRRRRVREVDG